MKPENVSKNVIERLPKYYRCLKEMASDGVERASSAKIAEELNLTASQVRQDLSIFGGFGQQGYGYDAEFLKCRICSILGLKEERSAIIIGGGRIGQALADYKGFKMENVFIKAIFDVETSHVHASQGVKVLNVSELESYLAQNKTDVAIICVQKEIAKSAAERAVNAGVKAIWNFAPIDLHFGKSVACENINMSESLMRLIYKLKALEEEETKRKENGNEDK